MLFQRISERGNAVEAVQMAEDLAKGVLGTMMIHRAGSRNTLWHGLAGGWIRVRSAHPIVPEPVSGQ